MHDSFQLLLYIREGKFNTLLEQSVDGAHTCRHARQIFAVIGKTVEEGVDCPTFDCMHMVMRAATVSVFGRKQAKGVRSSESMSVSPDVVLMGESLRLK